MNRCKISILATAKKPGNGGRGESGEQLSAAGGRISLASGSKIIYMASVAWHGRLMAKSISYEHGGSGSGAGQHGGGALRARKYRLGGKKRRLYRAFA